VIGMQATSDKVVVLKFIATVYIWVTLHRAVERQKSNSSICTPACTDKDKRHGFSSVATCAFTYANVGTAACTFCIRICECWSF
jgi:hypothetical protein